MGKTLHEFLHGISSRELTLWIEYLRYMESDGRDASDVDSFMRSLKS